MLNRYEFSFLKYSKIFISISLGLMVISVVLVLSLGLRLGIDFTGGSMLELSGIHSMPKAQITQSVESLGEEYQNPIIQKTSKETVIIRTKFLESKTHEQLLESLKAKNANAQEERFTTIGPSVGEVLQSKGIQALIIAIIAIVIYVSIAFSTIPQGLSSWKFGFTTIFALVHDVLITLGIFAILGHLFYAEIDTMFITAILTVLGFSVHDTIVVFDRMRENIKNKNHIQDVKEVADLSLNQTISRSINTSITVLFALAALLAFAGSSIFYFVLTLFIGVIIGTYSSIFLATPLLAYWIQNEYKNLQSSKNKR